ncbi:hypothetical protein [Selenomonas sp. FC4001]|uniref:hypothetical protein n=1 Tax=Selenomonas sp. FC4001 TaxID=1408313 RepID=UPI00055AFEDF|nr:hypothetical protein [Selenomonas sp. FC4001]
MKKKILAAIFSGLVLWGGSYGISSAQEVLIHDQQYGAPYWIMTETISQTNNVITADVGYGQNKSRKHTYKFMQKDNVWYCQNPGSWNKWVKVEAISSDNDILYVVLQNLRNIVLDYGETVGNLHAKWYVDLNSLQKADKEIKIRVGLATEHYDVKDRHYHFMKANDKWLFRWNTPAAGKHDTESSGSVWQNVATERLANDILYIALSH